MGAAIKGSFGKDKRDRNGLDSDEAAKLAEDNPVTPIYVVGTVLPDKLIIDRVSGTRTDKFALDSVEVVTGADALTVKEILDRHKAARTGQGVAPSLFDQGTPMDRPGMQGDDAPWDQGPSTVEDTHPPAAAFVEPGMDEPAPGSPDALHAAAVTGDEPAMKPRKTAKAKTE